MPSLTEQEILARALRVMRHRPQIMEKNSILAVLRAEGDLSVTQSHVAFAMLLKEGRIKRVLRSGMWYAMAEDETEPFPSFAQIINDHIISPELKEEILSAQLEEDDKKLSYENYDTLLKFFGDLKGTASAKSLAYAKGEDNFTVLRYLPVWSLSLSSQGTAGTLQASIHQPLSPSTASTSSTLTIGYPVQIKGNDVVPIFYITLSSIKEGSTSSTAEAFPDDLVPMINERWLDDTFGNKDSKQRRIFKDEVDACTEALRIPAQNDGRRGCYKAECWGPLIEVLKNNLHRELVLSPSNLRKDLLSARNGICNCAVLGPGREDKYTQGILHDLQRMRHCSLKDLKETALYSMLFGPGKDDKPQPFYPELVCNDEQSMPFNDLQKQAAAAITQQKLTVLQGPPGTGKTQVIAAAALNAVATGKSVLIASYNHQAINSVIERLEKVQFVKDLAVRANDSSSDKDFSLYDALDSLKFDKTFSSPGLKNLTAELKKALEDLKEQCDKFDECFKISSDLQLYQSLKDKVLEQNQGVKKNLKFLEWCLERIGTGKASEFVERLEEIGALRLKKGLKAFIKKVILKRKLAAAVFGKAGLSDLNEFLQIFAANAQIADSSMDFANLCIDCQKAGQSYRKALGGHDDLDAFAKFIRDKRLEIYEQRVTEILKRFNKATGACDSSERESLQTIGILNKYAKGDSDRKNEINEKILKDPKILKEYRDVAALVFAHRPVWLCTIASARRLLPLVPGLFDLVIFDESSQVDFISALPVIFRAKSVAVVGDPRQLEPVNTSMSYAKQQFYLQRYFKDIAVERRLYLCNERRYMGQSINSLYTFAYRVPGAMGLQILDSYRSCPQITGLVSSLSYEGDLKCRTDTGKLKVPSVFRTQSLKWEDAADDISFEGGSRNSRPEAAKVLELLKKIKADAGFKGSVGVISPYRGQCKLIDECIGKDPDLKDLLNYQGAESDPQDPGNDFFVATVHKVQGSERDVIILSLCLSSSTGNSFACQNNLLNVAISRARSGLYVVGNIKAALSCNNADLNKLLRACKVDLQEYDHTGEWIDEEVESKFESPLERMLYLSMKNLGLEPEVQHKIHTYNRRLDFALIDKEHDCYLDIEVDGSCHLDSLNRRKKDDYERDAQLRSLNFNIIRFWGREVYRHPDDCAQKVKTVWEQMQSAYK